MQNIKWVPRSVCDRIVYSYRSDLHLKHGTPRSNLISRIRRAPPDVFRKGEGLGREVAVLYSMSLTFRQRRFVNEYLVELNAAKAAIRAGYSPKTAKSQGSRLLTNVDVN
jgi:hypothetical protein